MTAMLSTWPASASGQNEKKKSVERITERYRNALPHRRQATQKLLLGIGEKKQSEN
jgi:hypothetical protein